MKTRFIQTILMILFCLVISDSKAQSANWVPLGSITVDSSSSVLVYYAESCMDSTAVLLKFTNTGNTVVHLNWSLFNTVPVNELELSPNEEREGICSGFELLKEFIPNGMTVTNINLVYTIQ